MRLTAVLSILYSTMLFTGGVANPVSMFHVDNKALMLVENSVLPGMEAGIKWMTRVTGADYHATLNDLGFVALITNFAQIQRIRADFVLGAIDLAITAVSKFLLHPSQGWAGNDWPACEGAHVIVRFFGHTLTWTTLKPVLDELRDILSHVHTDGQRPLGHIRAILYAFGDLTTPVGSIEVVR